MLFSVKYIPTTLFSLKDSNSTNSGAKALFLPSPYAIKMAILNQAITIGGELEELQKKSSLKFQYIRDTKISFFIGKESYFSVNNTFIKILKPARERDGFQQTVAFRQYLHLTKPIEIIFEVSEESVANYLKNYLHKINYFGKRGCFFQFLEYSNNPNIADVVPFSVRNPIPGILQEYDDFDDKVTFDNVSSFSNKTTKRKKQLMVLPLKAANSSKAFTVYENV